MDQRRTDTRTQLQAIALELFVERGYDGTSLREIAERLSITKAAVYYHFRTKDEILISLIEEFLDRLDDLASWAMAQQPGTPTRVEVLRRYDAMLSGQTAELARLMREGQSAVRDPGLEGRIQDRYHGLFEILRPPGDPAVGRLQARVALSTLHMGTAPDAQDPATDAQRRAASLQIATHLLVTPLP